MYYLGCMTLLAIIWKLSEFEEKFLVPVLLAVIVFGAVALFVFLTHKADEADKAASDAMGKYGRFRDGTYL